MAYPLNARPRHCGGPRTSYVTNVDYAGHVAHRSPSCTPTVHRKPSSALMERMYRNTWSRTYEYGILNLCLCWDLPRKFCWLSAVKVYMYISTVHTLHYTNTIPWRPLFHRHAQPRREPTRQYVEVLVVHAMTLSNRDSFNTTRGGAGYVFTGLTLGVSVVEGWWCGGAWRAYRAVLAGGCGGCVVGGDGGGVGGGGGGSGRGGVG